MIEPIFIHASLDNCQLKTASSSWFRFLEKRNTKTFVIVFPHSLLFNQTEIQFPIFNKQGKALMTKKSDIVKNMSLSIHNRSLKLKFHFVKYTNYLRDYRTQSKLLNAFIDFLVTGSTELKVIQESCWENKY